MLTDLAELGSFLNDTGFKPTPVPADAEPTLPADLHMYTIDQLRELLAIFGSWYSYVSAQTAVLTAEQRLLKLELTNTEAELIDEYIQEGRPQAHVKRDPRYRKVYNEYTKADIKLDIMKQRQLRLSKSIDIISRMVTITLSEQANER